MVSCKLGPIRADKKLGPHGPSSFRLSKLCLVCRSGRRSRSAGGRRHVWRELHRQVTVIDVTRDLPAGIGVPDDLHELAAVDDGASGAQQAVVTEAIGPVA